jgi:hypothetical protein
MIGKDRIMIYGPKPDGTYVIESPARSRGFQKNCRACTRGVRMFLYIDVADRPSTCDGKSS